MENFEQLIEFLSSKSGLRMAHVYKPVMLLTVIRGGGKATKRQIAKEFALSDSNQVDYYQRKIVHNMPGKRLVRDGLLIKAGDTYSLGDRLSALTDDQLLQVEEVLKNRIDDYLTLRNPFATSNTDAVSGSVRYEILRRAGARCELCGASSKETQIDVDHIVPRARGGSNDLENLQALCRTCNSQKRDRDSTNFHTLHEDYDERESNCVFCSSVSDRIISKNSLAYVIRDGFPVTELHTLVIPKRHVSEYFELTQSEINAMHQLLLEQKLEIARKDRSISGYNVGVNCGKDAGQTIFHCHMHLIPRRHGDVSNPRGGIRHVIPDKGDY